MVNRWHMVNHWYVAGFIFGLVFEFALAVWVYTLRRKRIAEAERRDMKAAAEGKQ